MLVGAVQLPGPCSPLNTRTMAHAGSASGTIRAATLLRAIQAPCSGRNYRHVGNDVCGPFLSGVPALIPTLPASILLWTCSARLHAPTIAPFASNRSRAMSSTISTPGFGWKNGFFTAGAFVSGSVILNVSPILYLAHIASLSAIGNAP
jgi:hypothetical protein